MSGSAPLSDEHKKAEAYVQEPSSEGGYASQQRETRSQARLDQMENDLELKKSNKVSTNKVDEVAGRKGKGMLGADKLA